MGGERRNRVASSNSKIGRVFTARPDRVAAAWRRVRFSQAPKGQVPDNLLDDVVENFVREVGEALGGAEGSAWARTRGVLRISMTRGVQALYEEFAALRRCLIDAIEVLGGAEQDRAIVHAAVDEAVQSSAALFTRLTDPLALEPATKFGGVVVEYFERAQAMAPALASAPTVH
jgi:hypothetical protein